MTTASALRDGDEAPLASPMKVLVVFHEDVPGGATLSVLRLLPELEGLGWRFAFWAPAPSALFDELRERRLEVMGAPRPLAFSRAALRLPPGAPARLAATPGYFRAFRRALRKTSPAIVHANSIFTLVEALLARATGIATVLHVHEMAPEGFKGRIAARLAASLLEAVVTVSQASADRLAQLGAPSRIIYEGTPIPPAPGRKPQDGRRVIVGTVAVISRRKGSDIFVEAARLVRERDPDIEFRMIGSPTDALDEIWAARVIALADEAGIVRVPHADVLKAFRGWDVFVLPSRWDPFPIASLEAMASGLAVVGSRVDGIPEQLAPRAGVLVDPDDPQALADAILSLSRDPHRRRELGAAARRRVIENFSIGRQVDAFDQLYHEALQRRGVGEAGG